MTTKTRYDVRQRILELCQDTKDMPEIMEDSEMQVFSEKYGERNVREMVHALTKSGLIFASGATRDARYLITKDGKLIYDANKP